MIVIVSVEPYPVPVAAKFEKVTFFSVPLQLAKLPNVQVRAALA